LSRRRRHRQATLGVVVVTRSARVQCRRVHAGASLSECPHVPLISHSKSSILGELITQLTTNRRRYLAGNLTARCTVRPLDRLVEDWIERANLKSYVVSPVRSCLLCRLSSGSNSCDAQIPAHAVAVPAHWPLFHLSKTKPRRVPSSANLAYIRRRLKQTTGIIS
jgi:hypothetical protein